MNIFDSALTQLKKAFVERPTFIRRTFTFRNFLTVVTFLSLVLTILAKYNNYFKSDLKITLFIQQFNPAWFDFLMRFLSFIGNGLFLIILIILLAVYGYLIGKRKAPLILVASTTGGLLVGQLLKVIVGRPRPDPTLINQIGHFLKSDSFPSGHVLGAISFYGFLLYIAYTQLKKGLLRNILIVICALVVILMGLSRIYLGAHWFSDVAGAYLIGIVWLSAVTFIYQRLKI